MNHASLFSGIGGFDLAAEWMGWDNIFHCEINPFGQKILKYYYPNATSYGDITKTDFTIYRGTIDILTGGFPCQPYSVAGKRKGKSDERHLWPEMLRAIQEIRPEWVVGENVRGIISWNAGLVFDEVQTDLEIAGYEVLPFLLPAASINAPHERNRTFFIAHSNRYGHELRRFREDRPTPGQSLSKQDKWQRIRIYNRRVGKQENVTDTKNVRLQRISYTGEIKGKGKDGNKQPFGFYNVPDWRNFPTQSPICGGDDGFSTELDGITFPKWRNESIKAYGNAIVPQVAYQIFKAIQQCQTS